MRKLLLFIAFLSLFFSGLRCTRPKAGEDGVEAASPLLLFSTSSFHPGGKSGYPDCPTYCTRSAGRRGGRQ